MKIFKIIKISVFSLFFLILLSTSSYALEITKRENLKFDNALSETEMLYSQPRKIYITQVVSANKDIRNDTASWIRSIYYYSITKLKLNDIPFNYLIDNGGHIYEVSKSIGVNPGIEGGDNIVLIGLLDSAVSMTPSAQISLTELVQTLSYDYGIKEWDFVNLSIVKNENERSYLKAQPSKTSIYQSIEQALLNIQWSDTEHLTYSASIEKVEYPKEVEVGKRLDVVVTVKNESDFSWFGDSTYIYVSTKDNSESSFAINSVWESFSKPTYIKEKIVKPGESVNIQFSLLGKSKPGEYKEEFVLSKDKGIPFENSNFEVAFNIVPGTNKLVEIISPEYGFVNIRDCRWYSCTKVEVANHGDVFITTKKEEGWYEIKYYEESLGWIYQKYIKEL